MGLMRCGCLSLEERRVEQVSDGNDEIEYNTLESICCLRRPVELDKSDSNVEFPF